MNIDNNMPKGWEETTLNDVVSILGDGLHGTPKYTKDGEYYFINGNNLNEGEIKIKQETKRCSQVEYEKYKKNLNSRTILVSINGSLGYFAYYNNEKCFLGKSACYFNVKDSISKRFIGYQIRTRYFQKYIERLAGGTTIKNVSLKTMREFPFIIPKNLEEQKSIANILAAFDNKIELLQAQNLTLERAAQTIYREWFGKYRIDDELPEGWKTLKIDDVVNLIIDYRGKTPKKLGTDWSENGIPALSAKSIKNGKIVRRDAMNFGSEELYSIWMKDELQKGDILLTSEAPLGEMYYLNTNTKYILSQRLFALRVNEKITSQYLYYYLFSKYGQHLLQSRASGSTVAGIRQSELRKVEIIIPTQKILFKISKIFQSILEKQSVNNEHVLSLKNSRDTLLPKLMSGQLRVNEYKENNV
ncbi:MAG: hypothetical protein GY714_29675 [Desulfobacterales bacterium]|nr:hypothetical protein [Desulfobacterales bacterium]